MHQVVSQVRRHGMVPVFCTLDRRGNHLVRREVSSTAAGTRASCTGAGSTWLLLTAVRVEKDVAWQWNDVLRLVVLLLLLLQLSIWLLLLLLLEGSSHLGYTLVGPTRSLASDWQTATAAGSTNTGSITGGVREYVVHHHLVRWDHHPGGTTRARHLSHSSADHLRASLWLLLTGHSSSRAHLRVPRKRIWRR